jgi:hypothetical protein
MKHKSGTRETKFFQEAPLSIRDFPVPAAHNSPRSTAVAVVASVAA